MYALYEVLKFQNGLCTFELQPYTVHPTANIHMHICKLFILY
jgi:hypothetical protein